MIRQVVWLALAMSVLFNVFFAAGYLQARARDAVVDPVADVRPVEPLGLDETQEDAFRRLQRTLGEDLDPIEQELALTRRELMDSLQRPEADLDQVRSLLDREADLQHQRIRLRADRLSEFVGLLSPEQRRRICDRFSRRHRDMRERTLEQFDADGDGVLNDDEKANAQKAMDTMREDREQQRAEMLKRFDADGDGNLNWEERQDASEWFRENHPRGRRGDRPDGRRGRRGDSPPPPLM